MADDSGTAAERRGNPQLRALFIEIYDVLQPFFDDANAWAGHTHEHLAFRALHELHPELSGEEVLMIVTAAKRVFGSGSRPGPA